MSAIGAGRPRPRIFGATPSVGRPARIQSRFLSPIELDELYNFAIMHFASSDASFTTQKFVKVSISRKFKVAKITFATPPKPQVLRTCKLYDGFLRVSRSASWVLDFCTQPGRCTTPTSGSTGSRGAAPARRPAGP